MSAQPPPTGPGEDPFAARPEPDPLVPQGEDVAWSALGTLLAGPITWGGVGWLADRWLGTSPTLTVIGVVVGAITAFAIVYLRFGRDDGA
jgi:ATP synthase protein I